MNDIPKMDVESVPTQLVDDYDWSLPNLELPKEFYKVQRKQQSSHGDVASEVVACGLRKQFPNENITVSNLDAIDIKLYECFIIVSHLFNLFTF